MYVGEHLECGRSGPFCAGAGLGFARPLAVSLSPDKHSR